MNRVNNIDNTLWHHEWMFAHQNAEYNKFIDPEEYDPSCRKGYKVKLIKDNTILNFNSKNKAIAYINSNKANFLIDAEKLGYTVEIEIP